MAYPCWCHSCSKICRGRHPSGHCLDTDLAEMRRRSAAVLAKCGLDRDDDALREVPVQLEVQTKKSEPPAVAVGARTPDLTVAVIPAPAQGPNLVHCHQADFRQWRILLDGAEQTDVWCACVSAFQRPYGFVQYADRTQPTRHGTVEIRAACIPQPKVAPLPVAAPQLTMEL